MKDALGDSDDEGKAGGGDGAEEGALPALSDSEGEGEKKEEVGTKLAGELSLKIKSFIYSIRLNY